METVTLDNAHCKVQVIPGDGNCLFGAVVHQLFRCNIPSIEHTNRTREMRNKVVECISANLDDVRFVELIRARVRYELSHLYDDNDKVRTLNFLNVLKQDMFWGDSESMLAIAIIYRLDIVIYRENGFRTVVSASETDSARRITVVFRGQAGNWNHYDSFLGFIDDSAITVSMNDNRWWSLVGFNGGKCVVLKIQPDGNCMFSSIAHQLFGSDINSGRHVEYTKMLRRQAVDFLRSCRSVPRYRNLLDDRIAAIYPAIVRSYVDTDYEALFERLSMAGTWGGNECLTAIAELYRRNIRTIWEDSTITFIRVDGVMDDETISIVYRKSGQQWNHYDSFLCFERLRVNVGPVDETGIIDLVSEVGSQGIELSEELSDNTRESSQYAVESGISTHCPGICESMNITVTSVGVKFPIVKVGTWNVRGVNSLDKRVEIDSHLSMHQFSIVALQETKLVSHTCDTKHYKWILGTDVTGFRNARRIAFLVHLSIVRDVRKVYNVTPNILAMEVINNSDIVLFINVHMPQDTHAEDFGKLRDFVMLHDERAIIILGDFNAHLGIHDLTEADKVFIGSNLYHDHCNDNGEDLKQLLHIGKFSVKNTWSKSPSVRITWTNNVVSSQIDHMLCNEPLVRFRRCFASWVHSVCTDHALLSAELKMSKALSRVKGFKARYGNCSLRRQDDRKDSRWEISRLMNEKCAEEYRSAMRLGSNALIELTEDDGDLNEPEPIDLWNRVRSMMVQVASATIPMRREIMTPEQVKMKGEYLAVRKRLAKRPHNIMLQGRAKKAKRDIEEKRQADIDVECSKFFRDIESVHPCRRISMTYRYIKRYRRKKPVNKNHMIPISHWEQELRSASIGTPPVNITENDYVPLSPPPSASDVNDIIQRMKNGTCPGRDTLQNELFKNAPAELIELIVIVLRRVWVNNKVPSEWLDTDQVPLPKVPTPKTVDDFRRLTMSNSIYKLYASYLLSQLESYIGDIPLYQAGFLRNRSTDDHVFTLRRICEERWRKGCPTYVLSLDLRKAFDMVNTHRLGDILLSYGVPAFLINRIITAILHERTSVRWDGRRTTNCDRTRGVKQGCPISPYLFVVIMHYAMKRVCDRLGIDLNLAEILLPLILAYADDIIVIGDSVTSLDEVFVELESELRDIGLNINEKKCSVLLRDPLKCEPPVGEYLLLNGKRIKIVSVMKYLGVYISADLDRRSTVANRIQLAYRSFYTLLPFLRAHRLPLVTLLNIYHVVIVTTVLYGLKVATLTKRNRQSLRRMERNIVLKLKDLARNKVDTTNIPVLLGGRTINRKTRVQRIKYWGHVVRRNGRHILRRALVYSIHGKKKCGRPCFTWNDSLKRDLQHTRDRDWNDTINDTKLHNAKCNDIFNDTDTDESDY